MIKGNKIVENKKMYNLKAKTIRDEINSLKDNNWLEFLENQGNNPVNTKTVWQRLNKLKGKKSVKVFQL